MSTGDPPADILDQIDSALADVSTCFCGCKTALRATSPSPWFASEECQARWALRQIRIKSGTEEAAGHVEAAAAAAEVLAEYMEQRVFADLAVGPAAGGSTATADVRRQVQDGTAPLPGVDRVHDACRVEVIRQGLHEYWLDGVRYVIDHRRPFPGPAIDGAMESVTQDLAAALDELVERAEVDVQVHRYECPHARCDWKRVALDRGVLLDLAEAHELEEHDPRPWWRRILPGGKR